MSTQLTHELYNYCQSDNTIPLELISQLDELTFMVTHQNYNAEQSVLLAECWKIVASSVKLWENLSIILSQNMKPTTKVHALMIMCQRIKNYWYFEEQAIKDNIKKYVCNEAQNYNSTSVTPGMKVFYRKINDIIVEILKY